MRVGELGGQPWNKPILPVLYLLLDLAILSDSAGIDEDKASCLQLEGLASELPLPEVDTEHVSVLADDAVTFANADAISQPESSWKALAAPLLSGPSLVVFAESGG